MNSGIRVQHWTTTPAFESNRNQRRGRDEGISTETASSEAQKRKRDGEVEASVIGQATGRGSEKVKWKEHLNSRCDLLTLTDCFHPDVTGLTVVTMTYSSGEEVRGHGVNAIRC
ncbi:hypothetical protein BP5796_01711 [Coleophoma crateriformis]|uniref:Uncharacterized protein n=1 Tax=Coleophoma crateriformis TaxID=565419 RepID=A0A3D8T166_9HELO|nr:hypothetical protein BP5796_01711 [Coleophoma crateriformis]